MIDTVRKLIAIALIIVGVIGLLVGIATIIGPLGTQLTNDNAPFAAPPSLITSLLITTAWAAIIGIGVWLYKSNPTKS